jgi:hypothetical protein
MGCKAIQYLMVTGGRVVFFYLCLGRGTGKIMGVMWEEKGRSNIYYIITTYFDVKQFSFKSENIKKIINQKANKQTKNDQACKMDCMIRLVSHSINSKGT